MGNFSSVVRREEKRKFKKLSEGYVEKSFASGKKAIGS